MIAPGIKGLVMSVFTLPSFEIVFKLIKDKFGPSKNVTRQTVLDKYHLVKVHDLGGSNGGHSGILQSLTPTGTVSFSEFERVTGALWEFGLG